VAPCRHKPEARCQCILSRKRRILPSVPFDIKGLVLSGSPPHQRAPPGGTRILAKGGGLGAEKYQQEAHQQTEATYPLPQSSRLPGAPARTSCWCWFCIRGRGGDVEQYKTKRNEKSRLAEKKNRPIKCQLHTASWHDEVNARKLVNETKGYKPEAYALGWHRQTHLLQHCGDADSSFLTLMVGIHAYTRCKKQETDLLCEDYNLGGRAAMKEGGSR
jgi:hypothetical protein